MDSRRHCMRTTIVTGASSGIGAALARLAVARGWNVLAVARRADRLASLARETGCAVLTADVVARDAPARIVQSALQIFGRIDVVINNAGSANPGHLLAQSDAQIDAQWQLHAAAPLRLARASLAAVTEAGGGFVFIGSGLARVPAPEYGAYAPAKAAIRAAAIQLRRELRANGVFVTYVDPGVVDTEFSHASGMEAHPAAWHATPQHVARRIFNGIERRARRVNAVPWQTAAVVLAEWLPSLADAAMANVVVTPRQQPVVADETGAAAAPAPIVANDYDSAIEPLRRRMERVKLGEPFVRSLLVPGDAIDLNEAAMRWAGMPNKNERAALAEVLHALERAGLLEAQGDGRWKVLRDA